MTAKCWCSLVLIYGAMQQTAWSQVTKVQPWRDMARQILTLEDDGNLPAATELAQKLAADLERNDPGNVLFPQAMDRLALLKHDQGNYAEAAQFYEKAVEIWRERLDSPNIGLAIELNNLASLYSELGHIKRAETLRRQSLEIRLSLLGPASPELALCYSNLAVDTLHEGKYRESEQLAKQAIEMWNNGPAERSETDLAYNTLALIELHAGHYDAALREVQLALRTYYQHGKNNARRLAGYQHTLALTKQYTGDAQGAAQAFRASLTTMAAANLTVSVQQVMILQDYAGFLRKTGQKREAHKIKRQAAKELTDLTKNTSFKYSVDVSALISTQH